MSRTFDGSQTGANQEIIIAPAAAAYNNLSTFTWATRVYPTGLGGNEFGTVLIKDAIVNYAKFLMFNANGTPTLMAGVNGTISTASTTAQVELALNTWSSVVITFDFAGDKKVHMYINGVETVDIGSTTIGGTVQDDSGSGLYIGGDTFDDGWTGNLAEVAIWNTVLTGPQIASVAAATNGVGSIQAANLVGYWHLCGTMSPEPDVSGNGNDGVLSANPPTQGANSPGFSCGAGPTVTLISDSHMDTHNNARVGRILRLNKFDPTIHH